MIKLNLPLLPNETAFKAEFPRISLDGSKSEHRNENSKIKFFPNSETIKGALLGYPLPP